VELGFYGLEGAWWQWVDANCPSAKPKERAKWMSENTFSHDGTTWTRSTWQHYSNTGKTIVARSVVFHGADGRVIDNGKWEPNRRSDQKRNWGVGKE
jgi:hypothetical protein